MPRWKFHWSWIVLGLGLGLAACTPAATPTATPTVLPTATFTPIPTGTPLPPSATPTTAPTATDTPEPTRTAPPTVTPRPTELFQAVNVPVLRNGFSHAAIYIDPGAIVVHEGVFHMFYNGINGFPAPVGVGHATSPDGRTWTRASDDPVFGPAAAGWPVELRGMNLFVTSGVVEPDGTWVLYYYTLDNSGNFDGTQTIGRATAPGPDGPWTPSLEPVLEPGPAGAWDSQQVSAPDVTHTEEGYVMYYDASAVGSLTWKIGRATSPDGINWTKYDNPASTSAAFALSDPVLSPSPADWDDARALDPNVTQNADGSWVMIYGTNHGPGGKFAGKRAQLGYATSPDGISWTKSAAPLILTSLHPGWQAIYLVSLARIGNAFYLYFDVATAGTNVHLATFEGELE